MGVVKSGGRGCVLGAVSERVSEQAGGGGGRAWALGAAGRGVADLGRWCWALPWAVVVGCSTQRLFHTQARDRLTHGLSRDGVR